MALAGAKEARRVLCLRREVPLERAYHVSHSRCAVTMLSAQWEWLMWKIVSPYGS